jgi:hypothetical protein
MEHYHQNHAKHWTKSLLTLFTMRQTIDHCFGLASCAAGDRYKSIRGVDALIKCSSAGRTDLVELLMAAGANPKHVAKPGWNALQMVGGHAQVNRTCHTRTGVSGRNVERVRSCHTNPPLNHIGCLASRHANCPAGWLYSVASPSGFERMLASRRSTSEVYFMSI